MTPEEAMRLAKYQRPGVRLVVGPHEAREEWMTPICTRRLPGPYSWLLYDISKQKSLDK